MISVPAEKLALVRRVNSEYIIEMRKKEKVRRHVERLRDIPVEEMLVLMGEKEKLLEWYQNREKSEVTLEQYEEWLESSSFFWEEMKQFQKKLNKLLGQVSESQQNAVM